MVAAARPEAVRTSAFVIVAGLALGACSGPASSVPVISPDPVRVAQADLVRRFVETDPGWRQAVLFPPVLGDRWYCDVAPLGTGQVSASAGAGAVATVYAWVSCETYVRTAQGVETGSGTALPAVFTLSGSPPSTVRSFRAPTDATYAAFIDGLPAAVKQAVQDAQESAPAYVVPPDGDRQARATRALATSSPPPVS
jgi:hypothetical protein